MKVSLLTKTKRAKTLILQGFECSHKVHTDTATIEEQARLAHGLCICVYRRSALDGSIRKLEPGNLRFDTTIDDQTLSSQARRDSEDAAHQEQPSPHLHLLRSTENSFLPANGSLNQTRRRLPPAPDNGGTCRGGLAPAWVAALRARSSPPLSLGDVPVPRILIQSPDSSTGWWRAPEPEHVVVADAVEEVVSVLAEVETWTERGGWAVGFVSYEAGPAFEPALASHSGAAAVDALPLAWFALCPTPIETPTPARIGIEPLDWQQVVDRNTYRDRLSTIHQQIAAGNTYQVNFTVPLMTETPPGSRGLVRRHVQPRTAGLPGMDRGSRSEWPGSMVDRQPVAGAVLRTRWTNYSQPADEGNLPAGT